MKTAKDIMQTQVVSVGSDDPLPSVYRLFADEEISGAPVVDESGTVVGVVSIRGRIGRSDLSIRSSCAARLGRVRRVTRGVLRAQGFEAPCFQQAV